LALSSRTGVEGMRMEGVGAHVFEV
jgi:hypothetical protein